MPPNHENLLWDYADDLLSASERQQVEALIANDIILQQSLKRILLEKNTFSSLPLAQTPVAFASNVLAAWQQEQAETVYVPQKNWVIQSIAGFFVLFLVILLFFACWTTPSSSSISLPAIPSVLSSGLATIVRLSQPLVLLLLGGLTASFVEQLWVIYGKKRYFA